MENVSRGEIDRLGRRLRESGAIAPAARELYARFRDSYQHALDEVRGKVDDVVRESDIADWHISTRLKRLETLVLKLRRKSYSLSSFHDIAGCRLVVPTLSDVRSLLEPLHGAMDVTRFRDYHDGRGDGYRAWHLIIRSSGGQLVELQVRTDLQDEWANTSEKLAFNHDHAIKSGGGPVEIRRPLLVLSAWGWALDSRLASVIEQDQSWNRLRMLLHQTGAGAPINLRLFQILDTIGAELGREHTLIEAEIEQHRAAADALSDLQLP